MRTGPHVVSSPARAGARAAAWAAAWGLAWLGVSPVDAQQGPGERPSLVVVVMVDQLRADLLDRYEAVLTSGFKRVREEGFRYTSASHEHAITETAPGHATVSTGVHPSRHGIVANTWFEQRGGTWTSIYSVAETASRIVGFPESPGRSPANLLRSGIADWIAAAVPGAQVASISAKDRSAIVMGGQGAGHVYWLGDDGSFVTSRYYRSALPGWVQRFNAVSMPLFAADTVWESRVPGREAFRSRPDTASFEGDGEHTAFPHRLWEENADAGAAARAQWTLRSPSPDSLVLELGLRAIDALQLGRGPRLDFLSLSFSQTDLVGHDYGPTSREQLDNLIHLDGVLARLLDELDRRVGPGRWLLALSADHGVMTEPELRRELGQPGGRMTAGDIAAVSALLPLRAPMGTDAEPEPVLLARDVQGLPFVAKTYLRDEVARGVEPDSFAILFRNSLAPDRPGGPLSRYGVEVRTVEGTQWGVLPRGATHGSPYWYDRWVPLIFLGAGVQPGSSDASVHTTDLAPTLARLAGVATPVDLDGRSLLP